VTDVVPLDAADGSNGYMVTAKPSTRFFGQKKRIRCRGLVFSAGVLGTVNLLLKLKEKSLPRLSDKVGEEVRSNNETLVSVSTLDPHLDMSKGVAIGSILNTDDNSHLEPVRYGAGSDAWKWLHLPYVSGKNFFQRLLRIFAKFIASPRAWFQIYFRQDWARKTTVLLFMQSINSTLRMKRNIWGGMSSKVERGKSPTAFIPESMALTDHFARIVNGKSTAMMSEALFGIPSTAHILGGAVMGADASKGVINSRNEVFGYVNMYVCDGSMISANPGVNPSLSITAISERAMSFIPKKGEEAVQNHI